MPAIQIDFSRYRMMQTKDSKSMHSMIAGQQYRHEGKQSVKQNVEQNAEQDVNYNQNLAFG